MSWEDALRRMLPPTEGFLPHTTSPYGAIRDVGTSPHRGVDANYNVGPNGQQGINLRHPALRSPVDGIVTNAGEGTAGRIAIRDADDATHASAIRQHRRSGCRGADGRYDGQYGGAQGIRGERRSSSSLSGARSRRTTSRPPGVLGATRIAHPKSAGLRCGASALPSRRGTRTCNPPPRCAGSEDDACRKIGSIRFQFG